MRSSLPIARTFDRCGRHDAAERDDRDVGRAAANVYYHVPTRLVNGNARTDRREYRLFAHVCFFCTGLCCRLHDRAPLGRGHTCGHAHHHLGAEKIPFAERFLDVVAKHRLGDAVVGDDAIFHRTIRDNLAGSAAYHFFGVVADGEDFVVTHRNSDDRRLVEHDALARHIHEYRRRAEVDAEFGRE